MSDQSAAEVTVHAVQGQLVVLDADVARLFGVETERLNQQITRNQDRFGDDFAFRLTPEAWRDLNRRIDGSSGHGGRRKAPYVLTEHGVVMAATVLRSPQAAAASRMIVRTFLAARHDQRGGVAGPNSPAQIESGAAPALSQAQRHGLAEKLNLALGRALDAIADPRANTTVRDELREVAAEGIGAIKAYLAKGGVQNEKTLAEVHKLLAEADALAAETVGRHTENQHRQLALVAKQLRLAIEMQRYLETGTVESLMATLRDMEG